MDQAPKGELSIKGYRKSCTGKALETAEQHSQAVDPDGLILFGACFSPFVQMVWVALEELKVPYQYIEVDLDAKPTDFLAVSPNGKVPALKFKMQDGSTKGLYESAVIVDYLEDVAAATTGRSLLPPPSDPYARALVRLQAYHIRRHVIPAFYQFLLYKTEEKREEARKQYIGALEGLVELFERAKRETTHSLSCGLWRENGGRLGMADVLLGPYLLPSAKVLKQYRNLAFPVNDKFNGWLKRLFEHPSFAATCSTDDLYLDSYRSFI